MQKILQVIEKFVPFVGYFPSSTNTNEETIYFSAQHLRMLRKFIRCGLNLHRRGPRLNGHVQSQQIRLLGDIGNQRHQNIDNTDGHQPLLDQKFFLFLKAPRYKFPNFSRTPDGPQ